MIQHLQVSKPSQGVTEFDLANDLVSELPPIKVCGRDWYIYQNGAYRKTSRDVLRPLAQKIIPIGQRTARRERSILEHLEGRLQIPRESLAGAFVFADERNAVLVNTLNGIVRVDSSNVQLLPHSPDLNFTSSIACNFSQNATADLFRSTLTQILPDRENRELFQLCVGNFLFPDCRFEVAMVCFGEAGTGKSTIAEPIRSVLGDNLVSHLSMSQLCDPRSYSLPKLQFSAINLGTELDSYAVDESGNFKTIVSGEPMDVRPIYGTPFTLRTNCKLWFLSNHLPRFNNGTEAEHRRMRFVHFGYKPKQNDVTLKTRLSAEQEGVFNFMIEGLQKLLAMSEIPLGGLESQRVHKRFTTINDPIGSFVREFCDLDDRMRVRKDELQKAFVRFCNEQNVLAYPSNNFFKGLYERYPEISPLKARGQGESERVQMVRGIALKSCNS